MEKNKEREVSKLRRRRKEVESNKLTNLLQYTPQITKKTEKNKTGREESLEFSFTPEYILKNVYQLWKFTKINKNVRSIPDPSISPMVVKNAHFMSWQRILWQFLQAQRSTYCI